MFWKLGHDADDKALWEAVGKAENPNKADDSGLTYLHVAVMDYRVGAAEVLLKNGAEPNCVDNKGAPPLCHAVVYNATS